MANVLLVDPDDVAFLALRGFLARGDHRSASVLNAHDAMVFLRENILVDLIIVELKLEDSTGLGFLRTLRNDYFFRNAPVVFYAARTTPAEIQEAYDLGVQSFHRKPYLEASIQDEVARVKGKAWYWSFFESDEVFCQRTSHSLEERGVVLEELVPVLQSTAQAFKEIAEKFLQGTGLTAESKQVEKQNIVTEITGLSGKIRDAAVPGLENCLKFLASCVGESRWEEFKDAAGALGYFSVLFSYRADIYKLEQKSMKATALLDQLAENDVLRSLPPHEVHALIPHLREYEIEDGVTLFKQEDEGDAMYLIDQGQLGVYMQMEGDPEPKKIVELGDGDIVGEMALIKNAPRSATIIAQAHTRMLRMEKDAFQRVILQSPQMKQAVQALAEQRSMDSIKKRAGEIDISEWSKAASEGVRKMGERIPKGFLGKNEKGAEDARREAASIEHWNKMVDKNSLPVVTEAKMRREIAALKGCPVIESAAAAFALTAGGMATSLHPLMDLVENDPGLAFQMLQIGNEVRQAKKKDTTTFIEDARLCVNFLGEKRLSSVAKALPRCSESFMYLSEEANWHNHLKFLLATAKIAQLTCKEMEFSYLEDTAFLGGLLHDIGKLLFLRLQPAGYIHVYLYAQQNNILIGDSERLHMGLSTRQMAIEFIEKKCFPTSLKNVIRWVEEPDQATEDFELVSVVAIARYMCRLCKVGFSGEINQKDLLPLEHTQLWASIQHRVFPSFNVGNFEALVRKSLRQL
jgi:CheY-like chemotaxis protein/HD-like signal output (HDOD) protein